MLFGEDAGADSVGNSSGERLSVDSAKPLVPLLLALGVGVPMCADRGFSSYKFYCIASLEMS